MLVDRLRALVGNLQRCAVPVELGQRNRHETSGGLLVPDRLSDVLDGECRGGALVERVTVPVRNTMRYAVKGHGPLLVSTLDVLLLLGLEYLSDGAIVVHVGASSNDTASGTASHVVGRDLGDSGSRPCVGMPEQIVFAPLARGKGSGPVPDGDRIVVKPSRCLLDTDAPSDGNSGGARGGGLVRADGRDPATLRSNADLDVRLRNRTLDALFLPDLVPAVRL